MDPQAAAPGPEYASFAFGLVLNLAAIFVFAILIYYRRHTRKDPTVVFAFFNIGLFVVVTVIEMTEVAAALGFGLFAILSIIRLRSEPFSNRELGYFFGALVLGLLNGIGTPHSPSPSHSTRSCWLPSTSWITHGCSPRRSGAT